jgi:hypothetical protein
MDEAIKIVLEKFILSYITEIIWLAFAIFLLGILYELYSRIRDKKLLETVTKSNRGTRSERDIVLKLLKSGIPAQTIFHDLYIKKSKGDFSQIDLVVVTKVGIIVFEVKDFSGWIFGDGKSTQ